MRPFAQWLVTSAVALAACLVLSACQTELYTALPQQEANEMLALLLQKGLGASKSLAKDGTETILIDEKQFAGAVELLRASGYPRAKFSTINDVFQPSGLIASPVQEQARFLWALGQELSRTVSQIDGVLTARVQVVLPDNDILKREPIPSSASIFVRYDEASRVPSLVPQIKMLVANSVQGLSYDKVSVVLVPVPHIELPPQLVGEIPNQQLPWLIGAGLIAIMSLLSIVFRNRLGALLAQTKPALGEAAE
jgi:type III secretion protein J